MKKLNILFVFFLLQLVGCKDFLDVKSNATLVVPTTLEDAQALLDDLFRMNELVVPSLGECAADDYYFTESVYSARDEGRRKFYIWDYQEYFGHDNDWGNPYAAIYNANLAIELLAKISKTQDNTSVWNNVLGSALFYRAFYFYGLLTVFAPAYDEDTAEHDLGIVLKLSSNFNEKSRRASVQECFDRIIADLVESLDYLPSYSSHVTRPSKGAALAALARVYLYKRDYEKALYYADQALLLNKQLMDFNGDDDMITINSTANASPFTKFNKETIFYAELTNPFLFHTSRGIVDSVLYNSYAINDLRGSLFFRVSSEYRYFRGNYTGNSSRGFGGLSTNELYLIKAECLALLNRPQDGISVLTELLSRRYKPNTLEISNDMTQNAAVEFIRKERRKELFYRSLRFSDLKRYNKEGKEIFLRRKVGDSEYILEPNSKKYALPLPTDLIDFTRMEQN